MNIDELVREALRDDRHALPAWPDATIRVRAGMSRRRHRRIAVAAAVIAVVGAVVVPAAIHLAGTPTAPDVGSTAAGTPTPGQVIPWQDRPVSPAPSFGATRSGALVASIDVASSVDPGTDLVYVVVLENRSDRDLSLDPCPVFVQQLGRDSAAHQLNCVIATLPATSWVRLQMRLPVPADASPGGQTLSWTVEVGGEIAAATAVVTIR
jgi:hypothetical protein